MQGCENIRYYRYSPVVNTSSTYIEMWAWNILRTQGLPPGSSHTVWIVDWVLTDWKGVLGVRLRQSSFYILLGWFHKTLYKTRSSLPLSSKSPSLSFFQLGWKVRLLNAEFLFSDSIMISHTSPKVIWQMF